MAAPTAVPQQPRQLPAHTGTSGSIRRFIGEVFGQFLTTAFWKELFKSIVHQAFTSFLMALGGTLVWYGKQKANKDINDTIAGTGGMGTNGTVVSKAFGGSSYPSYSSPPGYPVSHRPAGDSRFPGFGGP